MKPKLNTILVLLALFVAFSAACPQGSVPCEGRQSCTPRGGACMGRKCVDHQGNVIRCINQDDSPRMLQKLSRALRPNSGVHAAKPGRSLLQLSGLGNFLVGTGVAGFQRAINAAGTASQLANFYGIEGLGMRHRMGALPAPGGLELMALAGPAAMPGPSGFTVGWLGGTLEALAASVNPVSVAATGVALEDVAASQGVGQLIGADGLSGLGLGTGLAASAGLQALDGGGVGDVLEGLGGGGGPLQAAGSLLQRMGLPTGGGSGGGVAADPHQKKTGGVAAGLEAMSKALGGASNMASFAGNAIKGMQKQYTAPVTIDRTVAYSDTSSSMLGGTTDLSSYNTGGYISDGSSYSTVPYTSGYSTNMGAGMGSLSFDTSMSSMPSSSFTVSQSSSMPVSSSNSYTMTGSTPVSGGNSFSSTGSPMTSNMYSTGSMGMPVGGSSSGLMNGGWGQNSQGSTMDVTQFQSVGGQNVPVSVMG